MDSEARLRIAETAVQEAPARIGDLERALRIARQDEKALRAELERRGLEEDLATLRGTVAAGRSEVEAARSKMATTAGELAIAARELMVTGWELQLYPVDQGGEHHTVQELAISLDSVRGNFERFGLLDDRVSFLPGWFKDTLPVAPLERLAVLRLDGDMYGSTIDTLEALYAKVSPGDFIIVDDYILKGCRAAVDDYQAQQNINEPIIDVDGAAVYWRKAK